MGSNVNVEAEERSDSCRITKYNPNKNQSFHPFPGFRYISKTWKWMEVLIVFSFRFIIGKKSISWGRKYSAVCIYSNVREYMENVAHVCENYPSQYILILKIVWTFDLGRGDNAHFGLVVKLPKASNPQPEKPSYVRLPNVWWVQLQQSTLSDFGHRLIFF